MALLFAPTFEAPICPCSYLRYYASYERLCILCGGRVNHVYIVVSHACFSLLNYFHYSLHSLHVTVFWTTNPAIVTHAWSQRAIF